MVIYLGSSNLALQSLLPKHIHIGGYELQQSSINSSSNWHTTLSNIIRLKIGHAENCVLISYGGFAIIGAKIAARLPNITRHIILPIVSIKNAKKLDIMAPTYIFYRGKLRFSSAHNNIEWSIKIDLPKFYAYLPIIINPAKICWGVINLLQPAINNKRD
jgi:hypothetical protein